MLAPSNFEPSIVDHEALEIAEGVEGGSCRRINECDEANVLVRDVANVVQQAAPDNVANLLYCSLGMDVPKIDGAVAKVVDAPSGGGDGGGCDRLLSKRIRYEDHGRRRSTCVRSRERFQDTELRFAAESWKHRHTGPCRNTRGEVPATWAPAEAERRP